MKSRNHSYQRFDYNSQERQGIELQARYQQMADGFNHERESLIGEMSSEKERFNELNLAVQREKDEQLLIAENHKQEVSVFFSYFTQKRSRG